ncbi:hypothetical protein EGK70_018230 [Alcaligenes aquatilis]|uniref:hypothetical protein n=1 Tax=Alcaligenes TaxID=507 RepID=UPI000E86EEB7|nr:MULTISPECIES: hypothetical protein [Alcaligenes]MBQ0217076.1 hypothetical protein [Alcaligenes faecalis]QXR35722.1 hypothetical protein EGK70_018230 [Alcaligenes aquatilis]HBJ68762.1 hypothetical protein [Alcaligenes faecalis]
MKKLEQIDQLSAKLAHLDALLASLSGSGTVSFRELNNTHQANLLWLASELSSEANDLFEKLMIQLAKPESVSDDR